MDEYDRLAKEAVGWFSGWIRPMGREATQEDLDDVASDIAFVFREALKYKEGRK